MVGTGGSTTVTGIQLQHAFGLLTTYAAFTTITIGPGRSPSAAVRSALAGRLARSQALVALVPLLDDLLTSAANGVHGSVFPAPAGVPFALQRLRAGHWRTVRHLRTGAGGTFDTPVPGGGTYRIVYPRADRARRPRRLMPGPLLAIDGPFVLYRSFFALPDSIKGADGRPVNALLGAANIVLRIAADREPRAIVICFGAEAAHYRVELYPDYHAARPEPPEDLAWQFEPRARVLVAIRLDLPRQRGPRGRRPARRARRGRGHRRAGSALIMTGDRDMFQCATDRVSVVLLKPGKVGFEDARPRRGAGVATAMPPSLVPDFIALRGDPSDGLPGAPGIGPKTAAELLTKHGSLEAAIAAAYRERPRIAAALLDNADELRAFREIATLQPVPSSSVPPTGPPTSRAGRPPRAASG